LQELHCDETLQTYLDTLRPDYEAFFRTRTRIPGTMVFLFLALSLCSFTGGIVYLLCMRFMPIKYAWFVPGIAMSVFVFTLIMVFALTRREVYRTFPTGSATAGLVIFWRRSLFSPCGRGIATVFFKTVG
jgi:hypothetical protein